MSAYHRIVYIPFHMCLIFESHCVERIILRMISLIDVCLPGTVGLVFWLIQNLLPPLNTIFELLIYLHSQAMFFRIRMLFCLFIFMLINVGFT